MAQIGRYKLEGGSWTKYHQVLNVPSIFNLPSTTDGNTMKTEQYSWIGLLCHSRNAHQSGHFYAVFAYRGLYWIIDDGAYPRPVSNLQDNLRAQIVQVWVIPSKLLLPADLESELQGSQVPAPDLEKSSKRRYLGGFDFSFANITSLSQAIRQWICDRQRMPLFVVETHLDAENHCKTMQWLGIRVCGVLGQEAAQSPKGGTHGDMLLVYPAHMHFHFVQKQHIDGCGWYAVQWTFKNFELLIVMVYFKFGDGI